MVGHFGLRFDDMQLNESFHDGDNGRMGSPKRFYFLFFLQWKRCFLANVFGKLLLLVNLFAAS